MRSYLSDIAFSPNSRIVAIVSHGGSYSGVFDFQHFQSKIDKTNRLREHVLYSVCFNSDGSLLAGIKRSGIEIWKIDADNPSFQIRLHALDISVRCKGMKISGAKALERMRLNATDEPQGRTMLEFFADRGAILDEEQQRTLAELRRKRAEEQQRETAEEAAEAGSTDWDA